MGNLRGWHPALRYSADASTVPNGDLRSWHPAFRLSSSVPNGDLRSWHPAFRLSSRLADATNYIVSGNATIRFFARSSSDIRLHALARSRL